MCTESPQFILRRSTEKSIPQAGLRLVYYNQRLRRLSANKRKLVCKVLKTLLTLFVFFLRLSFGLYILKSSFNLVRHVLGNIQYKNNKKTVLIVILFFLVHSCDDLSLSVQLRDKTQITHGLSSRNTGFSPRLNDGKFQ